MYEDDNHRIYSDEFCELQRATALDNFDANKAFFRQLPARDLGNAPNGLLAKHKNLKPVTDLFAWDGVEGVYLMVLGPYNRPTSSTRAILEAGSNGTGAA